MRPFFEVKRKAEEAALESHCQTTRKRRKLFLQENYARGWTFPKRSIFENDFTFPQFAGILLFTGTQERPNQRRRYEEKKYFSSHERCRKSTALISGKEALLSIWMLHPSCTKEMPQIKHGPQKEGFGEKLVKVLALAAQRKVKRRELVAIMSN